MVRRHGERAGRCFGHRSLLLLPLLIHRVAAHSRQANHHAAAVAAAAIVVVRPARTSGRWRWWKSRDFRRRFPVQRRFEIAFGYETFLTAEHVPGDFGLDLIFERTERALMRPAIGKCRHGRRAQLEVVFGVDVSRHHVRFFVFKRAIVATEAGRRSVA